MSPEEIKQMCADHLLHLQGKGGKHADFTGADLRGADLWYASLDGAILRGARLEGADLRRAILTGADLQHAILRGARLEGAILTDAILVGAILVGARLVGARLDGAILWNTIGNGREIISIQTNHWMVVYTSQVMQIGCEQHSIQAWRDFSDDEIDAMDEEALKWWGAWKPIIFA